MKPILAPTLAVILLVGAVSPAAAQYYERPPPPPPGYYGGYPPPPPPRYRVPFGRRCDATLETPYGPRQLVCPIVEAKPRGEPCACPPPRPPPGYAPGPYVGGRTIR